MRILILMLILLCMGCVPKTQVTTQAGPLDHAHASALIAKYSALVPDAPVTPDEPKVGDKCPQCNDPPGKCGVGKVGDGVVCDTCPLCKGDGKIDEQDLKKEVEGEPQALKLKDEPSKAPITIWSVREPESTRKIVWYYRAACPPCEQWEREVFPVVKQRGWVVERIKDENQKVPHFDIIVSGKKYKHEGYLPLNVLNSLK